VVNAFHDQEAGEPSWCFFREELVTEGVDIVLANAQTETRYRFFWVEADQVDDCFLAVSSVSHQLRVETNTV
jgi:hypothetical protein